MAGQGFNQGDGVPERNESRCHHQYIQVHQASRHYKLKRQSYQSLHLYAELEIPQIQMNQDLVASDKSFY